MLTGCEKEKKKEIRIWIWTLCNACNPCKINSFLSFHRHLSVEKVRSMPVSKNLNSRANFVHSINYQPSSSSLLSGLYSDMTTWDITYTNALTCL